MASLAWEARFPMVTVRWVASEQTLPEHQVPPESQAQASLWALLLGRTCSRAPGPSALEPHQALWDQCITAPTNHCWPSSPPLWIGRPEHLSSPHWPFRLGKQVSFLFCSQRVCHLPNKDVAGLSVSNPAERLKLKQLCVFSLPWVVPTLTTLRVFSEQLN